MTKANEKIILVVEDEIDLREILVDFLSGIDHIKIVAAADGASAKRIIESQKVAVIVSDIKMPGMSGIDLLSWVREQGLEIPFILLTGFADRENTLNANRLGAYAFLEKPQDLKRVRAVVTRALGLG